MKIVILFLIFLLSLSSCKKTEDLSQDPEILAIKIPPSPKIDQVKFVKPVVAKAEEITIESEAQNTSLAIEQKIIKTGDIRFETNDLAETYNKITTAAQKYNAIVQNDTEGKDYGSVFRRIIVRVPSKNFDLFLTEISKGVTYFDNKEIASQDVTEEYIDINARLKAKKVLESRYLELLEKAKKVTEMLEIEKQLSLIREEIESKEGQIRYMQSQISMSTITIEFYKNIANEGGARISYGSKIWNALLSGFNGISSFFIGLLSIWPFLIILAVGFYFIRKRFKKKTNQS